MNEIMQYIEGESLLHHLSPLTKLLVLIALVAICVLTGNPLLLLLLVGVIMAVAYFSRLSAALVRQLPLLVMLSATLVLLTVLTLRSGDVLFHLIPAGFYGSNAVLPVTSGAVEFGLLLSLRFVAMLFAFQLLVNTTRPSDLMNALLAIRFPVDYALMLLVALRFIPSLQIEGQRIHEAQLSRGYNPGDGLMGKIRGLRPVLVPLVSNSLAKTQVIGLTMDMRGYRDRRTASFSALKFGRADGIAMASTLLIAVVLFIPIF